MEAETDGRGCVDRGPQNVAPVVGEDIVVVRRGRAAGQGELAQGGRGRTAHDVLVQMAPDRIARREPAEEPVVGGQAACRPLVEVMVGVDQARSEEAAAPVHATRAHGIRIVWGGTTADGEDSTATDDDVTVIDLGGGGIHRDDGAAFDDGHVHGDQLPR